MEQYNCIDTKPLQPFCVQVPGSKSITNRALLLGALANGTTTLQGVLLSDDSEVFMEALSSIGYDIHIDRSAKVVTIHGLDGQIPACGQEREVYVGSAGTAARFLTAMLALSGQSFHVTSSPQMQKRPMKPLLLALEMLGARIRYDEQPYAFPFHITGCQELSPAYVPLDIDASSQFLSALLLCAVMRKNGLCIRLTGSRDARAYVKISTRMMQDFGVSVVQLDHNTYKVASGQHYIAQKYQIEPDISAACYFYALAAIKGTTGKVLHVHPDATQGDIQFLKVLQDMGCTMHDDIDGIALTGPSKSLKGINVDMSDFSDQTMTLAAIAPFADSETKITGVAHIRRQESDRIHGIVTELTRMGIKATEQEDGVMISPGHPNAITVHTYQDHRMAMAFAITGCRTNGMIIDDPMCCQKTFKEFFEVLDSIIRR